ncbi:sporulation protein [Pseudoxanthomonas kalamensis DSM 18571]|uniref:SPOR domain-containing protein n=1 Tax=Pseudoxanthomonas kalamensis TaxID=289483 RepID=UPI001391F916|nr:SPOR domain-containing protein [Pseudoxanthomonas kalamensis]KAF1712490.1 sporulation protein [Pseudoxanthomonas kalamensis DSM 18571]
MAARRNKTQAKRNSGNKTPGWLWLVIGLVLGLAVFFLVPGLIKKDGDGFFRPQPNPDAQPAPVADADTDVAPEVPATNAEPDAPQPTQYEFYDLLPGKEVRMSDAELAASAEAERNRAEQQRALQALTQGNAAEAPASAAEPAPPKPLDETTATTPATPTQATPAQSTETPAPAPTTVASADTSARYILQAGAFGATADAEATKAKVALLGLNARVEPAQINGKTVYRVRMGPYGSASELAEAKQKLANGGLPAMAIKAQ